MLWLGLLGACAGEGPTDTNAAANPSAIAAGRPGDVKVGGRVVSTVQGHPITVSMVERAARVAGVSPAVALRRLQDETLLAAAAEHAGLGNRREVRSATRRAMVQELLAREIEARVTEADVTAEELEALFERDLERWESPERRRSVHALARIPAGAPPDAERAAERWIRELHAAAAASGDPEAAILALRRGLPEEAPFDVLVEEVPPLVRRAAADEAYLAAIFGPSGPGLVPEPVRSDLGWHVIAVTEVVPARETTREEALAILREERLAALRAEAFSAWIGELARQSEVVVEHEVVQRFLSGPSFLGDGG